MSVVNLAVAAPSTGKRPVFGIEIFVGGRTFNEFALHESEAKVVDANLTLNDNEPYGPDKYGVTYKRRPLSDVASSQAEEREKILAAKAARAAAQG